MAQDPSAWPAGPPGAPGLPPQAITQAPGNNSKWVLIAGLGCGGVGFLAILVVLGLWMMTSGAPEPEVPVASAAPAVESPRGVCARASACCKKIVTNSGGNAEALKSCAGFADFPEARCEQPLAGYKKSAAIIGLTCD